LSNVNLKDFKKGDNGIQYKAGITPWKIKKGELALLVFEFYNPTDKLLTPSIIVERIERSGFLGGSSFGPLSEKENEFFVASEAGISEMKKGDLTKVYIPIFTTPNTEKGKYKIYVTIKCATGQSIAGVGKAIGKMALSAVVGVGKKQYIELEIEDAAGNIEGKNKFTELVNIKFGQFKSYYPTEISLDFRRTLVLFSNKGGFIKIHTQKTHKDEKLKNKLLSIYKKILPENPEEIIPINLSGTTLELHRAQHHSKNREYTMIQAVGYIPQQDRVAVIETFVFPQLVQETIEMLSSIEFVPEN